MRGELVGLIGLGVAAGLAATWWLRGHRYRRPDELGLPRRGHWWVAVAMPVLVFAAGLGLLVRWPWWVVLGPLLFVAAWLVAAGIDADVGRLPNAFTVPLAAAALLWAPAMGLAVGDPARIGRALLGAAGLAAGYFALILLSRLIPPHVEAMGMGDVKLALSLGAVLGWFGWLPFGLGIALTFGIGAVWALALILGRRAGLRDSFSFGPSMVIGSSLALFLG